jgi:hypothetical protein
MITSERPRGLYITRGTVEKTEDEIAGSLTQQIVSNYQIKHGVLRTRRARIARSGVREPTNRKPEVGTKLK